MEPDRRDTHTHIERDRRSGSGMAFIVGGLVVAVLVITAIIWGGGYGGLGGDSDVEISTQDEVPGVVTEQPADVETEVEIEAQPQPATEGEPETLPATPAE